MTVALPYHPYSRLLRSSSSPSSSSSASPPASTSSSVSPGLTVRQQQSKAQLRRSARLSLGSPSDVDSSPSHGRTSSGNGVRVPRRAKKPSLVPSTSTTILIEVDSPRRLRSSKRQNDSSGPGQRRTPGVVNSTKSPVLLVTPPIANLNPIPAPYSSSRGQKRKSRLSVSTQPPPRDVESGPRKRKRESLNGKGKSAAMKEVKVSLKPLQSAHGRSSSKEKADLPANSIFSPRPGLATRSVTRRTKSKLSPSDNASSTVDLPKSISLPSPAIHLSIPSSPPSSPPVSPRATSAPYPVHHTSPLDIVDLGVTSYSSPPGSPDLGAVADGSAIGLSWGVLLPGPAVTPSAPVAASSPSSPSSSPPTPTLAAPGVLRDIELPSPPPIPALQGPEDMGTIFLQPTPQAYQEHHTDTSSSMEVDFTTPYGVDNSTLIADYGQYVPPMTHDATAQAQLQEQQFREQQYQQQLLQQQQQQQQRVPRPSQAKLWITACKMRVYEVERYYPNQVIRSIVAQEAVDYYSVHGIPPKSWRVYNPHYHGSESESSPSLSDGEEFLEERYYDFELTSDDEASREHSRDSSFAGELAIGDEESDSEDEDEDMDEGEDSRRSATPMDIDKAGFNAELSSGLSCQVEEPLPLAQALTGRTGSPPPIMTTFALQPAPPPSPTQYMSPSPYAVQESPTTSPQEDSFYAQTMSLDVVPAPQPPMLPLPLPRLSTVKVPRLRNMFDIMVGDDDKEEEEDELQDGLKTRKKRSHVKGTPPDPLRRAEWASSLLPPPPPAPTLDTESFGTDSDAFGAFLATLGGMDSTPAGSSGATFNDSSSSMLIDANVGSPTAGLDGVDMAFGMGVSMTAAALPEHPSAVPSLDLYGLGGAGMGMGFGMPGDSSSTGWMAGYSSPSSSPSSSLAGHDMMSMSMPLSPQDHHASTSQYGH